MKKAIDVTIALVYYKTPNLLPKCIASIKKWTKGIRYEIIVVDNNSCDDAVQKAKKQFPEIITITNSFNNFATGGNNQVFAVAKGKFFLVLNPDITFTSNALFDMVTFLRLHKKIAAVSCIQVKSNNTIDTTCSEFSTPLIEFWETNMLGRFFKNKKKVDEYRFAGWDRKTTRVVPVIPDTIMMTKMPVLKKIGLYDAKIKLFFMENDLCQRIGKLGLQVCHLGNVSVKHAIGQSTKTLPSLFLYTIYEQDMLYYYNKYFGRGWWLFLKISFVVNRLYYICEPFINSIRGKKQSV